MEAAVTALFLLQLVKKQYYTESSCNCCEIMFQDAVFTKQDVWKITFFQVEAVVTNVENYLFLLQLFKIL